MKTKKGRREAHNNNHPFQSLAALGQRVSGRVTPKGRLRARRPGRVSRSRLLALSSSGVVRPRPRTPGVAATPHPPRFGDLLRDDCCGARPRRAGQRLGSKAQVKNMCKGSRPHRPSPESSDRYPAAFFRSQGQSERQSQNRQRNRHAQKTAHASRSPLSGGHAQPGRNTEGGKPPPPTNFWNSRPLRPPSPARPRRPPTCRKRQTTAATAWGRSPSAGAPPRPVAPHLRTRRLPC